VIIKLGHPGTIAGFDIDTTGMDTLGALAASVEGCVAANDKQKESVEENLEWVSVLPQVELVADTHNVFALWHPHSAAYTHIRLKIYPDGGVARLRVYGVVQQSWHDVSLRKTVDLAFVGNGGRVVSSTCTYKGAPLNLIMPGRGSDMYDGWLTHRSREAQHKDQVTLQLGAPGYVEKIEIDTHHFRGNAPQAVVVQGCNSSEENPLSDKRTSWVELVPQSSVAPHQQQFFASEIRDQVFTHISLQLVPDGGIMRVRVYGHRVEPSEEVRTAPLIAAPMMLVDTEPARLAPEAKEPSSPTKSTHPAGNLVALAPATPRRRGGRAVRAKEDYAEVAAPSTPARTPKRTVKRPRRQSNVSD